MSNGIKIFLALLLFCSVLQLPQPFDLLVKYVALIAFTILAYQEYMKIHEKTAFLYVVLALLFQPVFQLRFNPEVWVMINLLVGAGLVLSLFKKPKFSNE